MSQLMTNNKNHQIMQQYYLTIAMVLIHSSYHCYHFIAFFIQNMHRYYQTAIFIHLINKCPKINKAKIFLRKNTLNKQHCTYTMVASHKGSMIYKLHVKIICRKKIQIIIKSEVQFLNGIYLKPFRRGERSEI